MELCDKSFGENKEKLRTVFANLIRIGIDIFEYFPAEDKMVVYDGELKAAVQKERYLERLKEETSVHPDDIWKVEEICTGRRKLQTEIRLMEPDGSVTAKIIDVSMVRQADGSESVIGIARNIMKEEKREKILEEQVKRDSLTGLYNHFYGKELINEYLNDKNPYVSCGMMVVDIDYFKSVNDVFGHLFGDKVLKEISALFMKLFDKKDILMRAGGDEFVIFLKDISHGMLVKKANQLVCSVRKLEFEDKDYSMSCSAGVCFLPENVSGYTYDQLFENADWALYRAKENGKNRYEFCASLQRYELLSHRSPDGAEMEIDARYLRNDVISTAFEIFEKMNSFTPAIELLMKIIGTRFSLDRITVIQTSIKNMKAGRQFQWTSPVAPEVLGEAGSFTKEDFLTLFQSYDEYGTTVLQYDNMSMYSEDAQRLLMQGEANTVLYAAMFCEGRYTGAISFVVCGQKRYWTKQNRSQLGELTKIISAHLAKSQVLNMIHKSTVAPLEYDPLTGLLAFSIFKEETERLIIGGYAEGNLMVYSDFENFEQFNQKFGYRAGDQILKEYSNYIIEGLENEQETYFSRVIAAQFVLFIPCADVGEAAKRFDKSNREFLRRQAERFGETELFIRTGLYLIQPGDLSSSAAIDAANYARCQVKNAEESSVSVYDYQMDKRIG